jgi:predicted helicase
MAPYAVAHMKLGLELAETGYDFKVDERLRVYLTNTLEEAHEMTGLPLFTQWLADEASAASSVKRDAPVMVVLGNPPYSGHSKNKGDWIEALIDDYKRIGDNKVRLGQAKWLHNDYVKFIRFADWRIAQTGYGVLGFITDHSYVDSGTFVAMRAQLQRSFDKIYVLDLQGNAKRNKNRSDTDENVFDITQGVSIIIAVRKGPGERKGKVFAAQLRGTREHKYEYLASNTVATTTWDSDSCRPPYYLFVSAGASHLKEYERFVSIADVMPGSYQSDRAKRIGTGFVTTHDSFAIGFTRDEIADHIKRFLAVKSESEARQLFTLCGQNQWNYSRAREALRAGRWKEQVREVLYRPFDFRYTVWDPNVCVHRRLEVHKHLDGRNLALCVGQAGNVVGSDEWNLAFVTTRPVDFNAFYRGGNAVLPLYLYPSGQGELFADRGEATKCEANIASDFVTAAADGLGLLYSGNGSGDLKKAFGPEDVFHYIYSVLHAPSYRQRYAEFLEIDFPRIPVPSNTKLFAALVGLGEELVGLHTMRKTHTAGRFPRDGSGQVESPEFSEENEGTVHINKDQAFTGVPRAVWEHEIGGYQVLAKWLKDHKGRELGYDELTHFRRIVGALCETRRLMSEIDSTIARHGGWPVDR